VAFAEGAVDDCVLRNFSNVVPTLMLPAATEIVHQLDSLAQAYTRAHIHARVHAYSYVYMCVGGALGRGGEGARATRVHVHTFEMTHALWRKRTGSKQQERLAESPLHL